MMRIDRKQLSRCCLAVIAFAAFGCGEHSDTTAPPRRFDPSNVQARGDISDGAHGGNQDVFLLPPLAPLPLGAPGFGDPFQGGLPVAFRVLDMGAPGTPVFKDIPSSAVLSSNLLQAYLSVWDTRSPRTVRNNVYRIQVLVGTKVVAFVDVKFVDDFHAVIVGTGDPVLLQQGFVVPLAVRIEKGWNCVNKTSCVTQTVPSTIPAGQKVIVSTPDNLNSLAFTGTWNNSGGNVVVTIEDVTSQVVNTGGCKQGLNVGLSQEHCVKVTTDPKVTLTAPVTIGTCFANIGDPRQLLIKYDVGETPRILPEAPPPVPCPTRLGSMRRSPNPLVRLASAALSGLGRIVGVNTAYAFDVGPGATIDAGLGFSFFAPTLPQQMSIVSGNAQTYVTGLAVPNNLVVRVSAVHDTGTGGQSPNVTNASVTCVWTSTLAVNNGDGTYTCPRPVLAFGSNAFKVALTGQPDQVILNTGNGGSKLLNESVTFSETGTNQIASDGFEAATPWAGDPFWNRNTLAQATNTAYPTYVSLAPNDGSNGHLPTPFAGSWAMWYGDAGTGNYLGAQLDGDSPGSGGTSAAPNSGQLSSPAFLIPAGLTSVSLSFETWWEIEGVNPSTFDVMQIAVKDVVTGAVAPLGQLNPTTDPDPLAQFPAQPMTSGGYNLPPVWTVAGASLTPFIGKTVQLIFTFDTGDARYNGFRGWLIDNVSVQLGGGDVINIVGSGKRHAGLMANSVRLNPVTGPGVRTKF